MTTRTLAVCRNELIPNHHQQQIAWSRATVSFATFQAIAGFAYSALFNASGGQHAVMFVIAAGAIVVALLLELGMRLLYRPATGALCRSHIDRCNELNDLYIQVIPSTDHLPDRYTT